MTVERIRGRKRQEIRARVLRANPLCVICEAKGIVTIATEVDHIIALTNDGVEERERRQQQARAVRTVSRREDQC